MKEYVSHLPKSAHVNIPQWFQDWDASVKEEQHNKDAEKKKVRDKKKEEVAEAMKAASATGGLQHRSV